MEQPRGTVPEWHKRVVDRSLARSAEVMRTRGMGPATRIVEAARALSRESGTEGFSIQDVVDRAGVALKTFYRHFGSKDALLLAVLEEEIREGVQATKERAMQLEDPLEQLRVIISDQFTHVTDLNASVAGLSGSIAREHFRLLELFPKEMGQAVASIPSSSSPQSCDAARLANCGPTTRISMQMPLPRWSSTRSTASGSRQSTTLLRSSRNDAGCSVDERSAADQPGGSRK